MKQREKEDIYKYWYLKDLRLADDVATYAQNKYRTDVLCNLFLFILCVNDII
jgi:hypothetical protein